MLIWFNLVEKLRVIVMCVVIYFVWGVCWFCFCVVGVLFGCGGGGGSIVLLILLLLVVEEEFK